MLKNLSVAKKIGGGFGIVLLLLAIVGIWSITGVSRIVNNSNRIVELQKLSAEMRQREIDHLNWANLVSNVLLDEHTTEMNVHTDPHECGFGKWYYGDERKKAEQLLPEITSALAQIEEPHNHLHESAIEMGKLLGQPNGRQEALRIYDAKTKVALGEVRKLLGQLIESATEQASVSERQLQIQISSTKSAVVILGILAMVIGVVIAVIIARGIVAALKNAIHALSQGSEQVSAASGQVSSSSESMAEGASEQASSLEETSASLEEMSSMSRQNADNAKEANNLAASASTEAEKGNEAMGRMVRAIQDIKQSSDETAKIIKTIDEIAFQTNLLALNAAVEAARAGEAGKGFAVVAEEVRNLAQRSAEAARNTSNLIEGSQKNADNGVQVAQEVADSLGSIVGGVRKVSGLINEIAAASAEQAQGVDQINQAMSQMDKVTQENASNAEESAAAAEELNAQAQQLSDVVGELQRVVGGQTSAGLAAGQTHGPTGFKTTMHDKNQQGLREHVHQMLQQKASKPRATAHKGKPAPQRRKSEEIIPLEEQETVEFETSVRA